MMVAGQGGTCCGEKRNSEHHLQESNGCLVSETKGPGTVQDAAWRPRSPGERGDRDSARPPAPVGRSPDTESAATPPSSYSRGHAEPSGNDSHEPRTGEWGCQAGRGTPAEAAPRFAEKLPLDRGEEEVSLAQLDRQDSTDQEGWEVVSRHSSWGEVGLGGSLEAPPLSPSQGTNCGRNTVAEARGQELDVKTEGAVAVAAEPQQVRVRFQVHYITRTGAQLLAVTGDHERLGRWAAHVPLRRSRQGLWARSVSLPAGALVQWKFVVVENGRVTRWEECSNRLLATGREDQLVHKCWGVH
ncbi:PREDICTED: starch-binding domain-containing protein 1 [Miniopterus natalensis]|uniref:starch-binding domain-containing protein 1 n=1 Tax=Miniopterus natalensis TaxID=291302 RepID=UPI0007A701C3|nr:PREDICTED: starch-binding domain-containing protein 1 [Miniopterus natalensis]